MWNKIDRLTFEKFGCLVILSLLKLSMNLWKVSWPYQNTKLKIDFLTYLMNLEILTFEKQHHPSQDDDDETHTLGNGQYNL